MQAAPDIKTPTAYLNSLPPGRKKALTTLHRAIRKAVPDLKPHIIHGMLGYGKYHYQSASRREGDTARVCLASQKQYISLYLMACDETGYLAEQNKARLGKVSIGKSCIRFKKLEDLNLEVALELIGESGKNTR